MKKILSIVPIVLLLAVACNSTQQAGQQNQSINPQTQQASPSTDSQNQQTNSVQAGSWKNYSNSKYHFELSYPSSWTLSENDSYIYIKPFANSGSNFTISTINVGRESVFDAGAKVKIQDTTFAGKKAKIYDCLQQGNTCPNQLAASVAIHLTESPTGWGQGNEIDYEVYKNDNLKISDFQQILDSIKFTTSTTQDSNWKDNVLFSFNSLADWQESSPSDWQFADYTYETQRRTLLKKYGTGKILLLSKTFNGKGCQTDCYAEGVAQNKLLASVKSTLSQNGWTPISWPTDPNFYTDYLYLKEGHPLILQVGTRDAVTGGMYVDIEFQY